MHQTESVDVGEPSRELGSGGDECMGFVLPSQPDVDRLRLLPGSGDILVRVPHTVVYQGRGHATLQPRQRQRLL